MSRLAATLDAIDAANAPHEPTLAEGRRFSAVLERLEPGASDALRLAARGAHVERFTRPRRDAPEGRAGYLAWRAGLRQMHAARVGEIMRAQSWSETEIARVGVLIRREGIKRDAEAQTLQDVICLDFIDSGFADFAQTQDPEKLLAIVAKTGRKMSARGRAAALALGLPAPVAQALESLAA